MQKNMYCFVLVIFASLLLAGCTPSQPTMMDDVQTLISVSQKPTDYFIQPGDELSIKFFYNPELNEKVFVRPDGRISLQLVDEVRAAGLTPSRLDAVLTQKYSKELKKPDVSVIVTKFAGQVYVGGEVYAQKLLPLGSGLTALQAIIGAGGLMQSARPEGVIIIRKGLDNRPIPIRVNLKGAMSGTYGTVDYPLQASDIVYVPKSAVAHLQSFVEEYIQKIFKWNGISMGYSLGSIHD